MQGGFHHMQKAEEGGVQIERRQGLALADHLILGDPLEVTPESARRVIGVLSLAEQSSAKGRPLPMPHENDLFGPKSK